ncbi:MAG: polysaccharide deacetylase family protein [Clostridia bacterium]|nr:polysaccharide deacetylase family protein [Clostridia bacterium]
MKKIFRILSALLICVLAVSMIAPATVSAAGQSDIAGVEIMNVKGGANGIVTWTFDDGYRPEAEKLNELCKKYGTVATLMLSGNDIDTPDEVNYWNSLISQGYLEAESHGWDDTNGGTITDPDSVQQQIVASRDTIASALGSTVLAYAAPSSSITAPAFAVARTTYYAIRMGSTISGGLQPLNPGFTTGANASAGELGTWQNLSVVRPTTNPGLESPKPYDSVAGLITQAAMTGGWYLSLQHGIAGNHSHQEMTLDQFDELMGLAAALRDEGKLWIATFGQATRYLREYQNSEVSYSGNTITLTMGETTEDGLALDPEVFNMALTVKVTLPDGWRRAAFTRSNGDVEIVDTKTDDLDRTFAYIDLLPGESVTVSNPTVSADLNKLGVKHSMSVSTSIAYNVYVPAGNVITAVKVDGNTAVGTPTENGMLYTTEPVFIDDIHAKHTFEFFFNEELGYESQVVSISGITYLTGLLLNEDVEEEDKQIGYDFLSYAVAAYDKLYSIADYNGWAEDSIPDDVKTAIKVVEEMRELIEAYQDAGFTATSTAEYTAVDEGSLKNVFGSAAFVLNEKPYYLFYLKSGFTGTVEIKYTDAAGEEQSTELRVVNGYYNLRNYIVFEVENVYDLISELSIKAEGTIKGSAVNAEGGYSLVNYANSSIGGRTYVKALFSYVAAASNYESKNAEN